MSLQHVRQTLNGVSLIGKNSVVVGGTSGIGRGVAKQLASMGSSVVIVGRKEAGVLAELEASKKPGSDARFSFVSCNSFLLKNVDSCVSTLASDPLLPQVDYLVLTQGMATVQQFTPTSEGLDEKLSLHVYSRMAFIRGMLPSLKRSPDPRVLSVLSGGVHSSYANYKKDVELNLGGYSIKNAADAAGFYNDICLDSLAKEEPGVAFFHAAPGFVSTNWGTEMPFFVRMVVRGLQVFGKSKEDAGAFMVHGMLNGGKNFNILNQFGAPGQKKTPLHDEAMASGIVNEHINAILAAKGSVAGKK